MIILIPYFSQFLKIIYYGNEDIILKIYIASFGSKGTGGSESQHQLCDILNKNGLDCYIYYIDKYGTPENLSKYCIKVAKDIEDDKTNILIVPETRTGLLYKYKKVKKVIWWLSWDFYFYNLPKQFGARKIPKGVPKFFSFFASFLGILFKKIDAKNFKFRSPEVFHLYNCEYIKENLLMRGIDLNSMDYLCGPIENDFFDSRDVIDSVRSEKKNIVCFNPAKDSEFSLKISTNLNNIDESIKVIPIENMTSSEVKKILMMSKVYIDFGFFPGPERMPREAVMSGCVIITGTSGAAKNQIDVPIPIKYKFEKIDENIKSITEEILKSIKNPSYSDFDKYIHKVSNQKKQFSENALSIINKISSSNNE